MLAVLQADEEEQPLDLKSTRKGTEE
jgi:hypothetical protein